MMRGVVLLLVGCGVVTARQGAKLRPTKSVARGDVSMRTALWEQLPPLIAASALATSITYPVDFMRAISMANAAEATAVAFSFGQATKLFTKGLAPELVKGTFSRVIKFGGYPVAHALLTRGKSPSEGGTSSRMRAGALCTVPEIAIITPLEVTKLALQLDAVGDRTFANSALAASRALVKAGGPTALYAGHFALQCRQAVWTAVFFAASPVVSSLITSNWESMKEEPALVAGAAGLAAGVLGALINNPIDVCRSVAQRTQLEAWVFNNGPGKVASAAPYVGQTFAAARSVVGLKGVSGLWSGCGYKALHLGFGGAIMVVLQPKCKDAWRSIRKVITEKQDKPAKKKSSKALSARGGATTTPPPLHVLGVFVWWSWFAGWHPLGIQLTPLGADFLKFEGSRDSDLGSLLSSLKKRKYKKTLKNEWLEILRVTKSAQSARVYHRIEDILAFALRSGLAA